MEKLDFGKGAVPLYIRSSRIRFYQRNMHLVIPYRVKHSCRKSFMYPELLRVRQSHSWRVKGSLSVPAAREPEFCFKIKLKSSLQVSKASQMKCWSAVYSRGHAGHISSL